jgi:carbamoyl-phosphate synthase large subunit
MKVLVTGAGALLGQGIIRALKGSTLSPAIVGVDPSPLSAGLFWCDSRHLAPLAAAPDYLDRLGDILRLERPDAVLVGTDVELPILAEHRHDLERTFSTLVLVSEPAVVRVANDKYLTCQFLRTAGFDYPKSCLPGKEAALIAEVGFPLVVKPRVGARSLGVSVVRDEKELERALRGRSGLVIQEYAGPDGQEFTASALVFDGGCEASIVMRRDLRDGNTYRAYVQAFPALNAIVRRMGAALNPLGPANFQFRVDREGRVKVFEINARFSGTTPLRALAGFNEVEMCLRRLLLGEAIREPRVEELVLLRHWSETVVRPQELASVR